MVYHAGMGLNRVQRVLLVVVALIGLLGLNGVFLYYLMLRREEMIRALMHPVALVFVIEAFVVVGLLAAYFAWRPLGRWTWRSFIVLSLVGGLAFSLPTFLLLNDRKANT